MRDKISAVFDCVMFLQAAARKESPAAACFDLVRSGKADLFISDEILDEVRQVFNYPKFRSQFQTLTNEMIAEFLDDALEIFELHVDIPPVFSFERDPKDEKYVNLAHYASVTCIVTRDRDLLDLMNGYDEVSKNFRQKFRPLKILDPIQFLRLIRVSVAT